MTNFDQSTMFFTSINKYAVNKAEKPITPWFCLNWYCAVCDKINFCTKEKLQRHTFFELFVATLTGSSLFEIFNTMWLFSVRLLISNLLNSSNIETFNSQQYSELFEFSIFLFFFFQIYNIYYKSKVYLSKIILTFSMFNHFSMCIWNLIQIVLEIFTLSNFHKFLMSIFKLLKYFIKVRFCFTRNKNLYH